MGGSCDPLPDNLDLGDIDGANARDRSLSLGRSGRVMRLATREANKKSHPQTSLAMLVPRIDLCKSFRILVQGRGEGLGRSGRYWKGRQH